MNYKKKLDALRSKAGDHDDKHKKDMKILRNLFIAGLIAWGILGYVIIFEI